MTYEMAAKDAIRHLHSLGLSPEEIAGRLSYPVSAEQIRKEISDFEAEKSSASPRYEYVRETDALGRSSYRRIEIP